jgi:hypothetical protein
MTKLIGGIAFIVLGTYGIQEVSDTMTISQQLAYIGYSIVTAVGALSLWAGIDDLNKE